MKSNTEGEKNFEVTKNFFKIIDKKPCVGRTFLSLMFNVSDQTIWRWMKAGMPYVLFGEKQKWYCLYEVHSWYLENIYKPKDAGTGNKKDDAELRKKVAEAEIKELELARYKGNLIEIKDISNQLKLRASYFKTALDELPKTIAVELLNYDNEKKIIEFLTKTFNEILEVFSKELEIRRKDEFAENLQT
ncbi:MAG: hypothetical protein ABIJ17_02600 [Patescibacteria group bacterium]